MSGHGEMLEATLDLLDEGVAVLDLQSKVVFWNRAAEVLTGRLRADLLSRVLPSELYWVDLLPLQKAEAAVLDMERDGIDRNMDLNMAGDAAVGIGRPVRVTMRHQLGDIIPAMLRRVPLRNGHGERVGATVFFRSVEEADTLPHGERDAGVGAINGQAELEDRLEQARAQWETNQVPFGVIWVTVDQASGLRKTHGRGACETMLRIIEQTLRRGLRPTEIVGRWGDDEFLIVSYERTGELLLEHARRLAGLAHTAEFRWWGDRVSLTVSMGTAQMGLAEDAGDKEDTLGQLLERAHQAMQTSVYAGGNQVTYAGGPECSQS